MANERLMSAMAQANVTIPELATITGRDPKTVSRWLGGRVPHPRQRLLVAKHLAEDEEFLWPEPGPAANSVVVTASAVVTDPGGRIILQRRVDNNLWALPGGAIELGESVSAGLVREVAEETGLEVTPDFVVAVYSDPEHVMTYDDGEVRQEFSVCVHCCLIAGTARPSSESHEVRWFAPADIGGLQMHPRIRVRITDYLSGRRAGLDP